MIYNHNKYDQQDTYCIYRTNFHLRTIPDLCYEIADTKQHTGNHMYNKVME